MEVKQVKRKAETGDVIIINGAEFLMCANTYGALLLDLATYEVHHRGSSPHFFAFEKGSYKVIGRAEHVAVEI